MHCTDVMHTFKVAENVQRIRNKYKRIQNKCWASI